MSTPFLVGNWKMNTTLPEAEALANAAVGLATQVGNAVDIGIAPPYPWLVPLSATVDGSAVKLGAQDCAATDNGAYTGDVSGSMLAPYCSFTIIGHSERRAYHNETDSIVKTKIGKALAAGLDVILCVGESAGEREAGEARVVVQTQLEGALDGMDAEDVAHLTIAYEPVWAIGTGVAATPDDAAEMSVFIREQLSSYVGQVGRDVRILYGGSANDENAGSFLSAEAVGGLLIGGASLKIPAFSAMVEAAANL
jgi:triosephosphate isomerase (TIM)